MKRRHLSLCFIATILATTSAFAHCPNGYIIATVDDARANVHEACNVIGRIDTVRLANGGAMSGSALGCKISVSTPHHHFHTLCKKPAKFVEAQGDNTCGTELTLVDPITAITYSDKACDALSEWSISRLTNDGSMSGHGYGCAVKKVDNYPNVTMLGNTLCAKYTFVKGKVL